MQSSKKITKGFIADFISDSTQIELDLKAPLNNPTFTGNVVVPDANASNEAINKGQLDVALSEVTITTDPIPIDGSINPVQSNGVYDALILKENLSNKGIPNGYPSLDSGGKIPIGQLPNSVMEYQGVYNASTNIPVLVNGIGNTGDVYKVSVAGLGVNSLDFVIGDYAIYNGTTWEKSHSGADNITSVFGRLGVVTAQNGDYTTALVTETTNKNYQTDNQKLFNDATSSIQTQLNTKAFDNNVIHKNLNETKIGTLTTYGSDITDGTYTFKQYLSPIRNNSAGFYNQPFFASDLGWYIFRPNTINTPARFYIMPNGTTSGLTSKFEMFNTDFSQDYTNYAGFNILCENTNNSVSLSPNRNGTGIRMRMRLLGDMIGSQFFDNASSIDFETNNDIMINRYVGAVSFGSDTTDPFALSVANQYTFKNPAGSTRVNIVGSGTTGGLYFGRNAIRTVAIESLTTTSDLGISLNSTNAGTALTKYATIFGATGNLLLRNGGAHTDNGYRLEVLGTTKLNGSVSYPIRTVTNTTTVSNTDYTILADATSGAITINLPSASTVNGMVVNVKKINNTANNITIDPNGAELIDFGSTFTLSTYLQTAMIQSNGVSWFIIN